MIKYIIYLSFLLFFLNVNSQIIFEKGYFVDNSDKKVECLIRNIDWKNNPTSFEYKIDQQDNSITAKIEDVKEFGINTIYKFQRFNLKIDRSSDNTNSLSQTNEPDFKNELLFLKVLIESDVILYAYEDGNLNRYFISTQTSNPEQLIYKSFYSQQNTAIGYNRIYRQQLFNALKCESITASYLEEINYKKKELISVFEKYIKCKNSDFIVYKKQQKYDAFNLTIRPGLTYNSLKINNEMSNTKVDFGSNLGFRVGLEAEFIMPFNNNKWSIFIEPSYQSYNAEKKQGNQISVADFHTFDLGGGVRHYFFLNSNSKIFVNLNYAQSVSSSGSIRRLDVKGLGNFAIGLGYKYKKLSIELQQSISREMLGDYVAWRSDFKGSSLMFGYTIF